MGEYPTDEELARLHTFEGTWAEYMTYIKSIGYYWPDNSYWSEYEAPGLIRNTEEHVYVISTGGWSGNESIISEIENEPLWFVWWESSRRGGHYEFRIPVSMLNEPVWHLAQPVKLHVE